MFQFLRVSALLLGGLAISSHVARADEARLIPRTDFGAILKLPVAERESKIGEVYGALPFLFWLISLRDGSPAREYSASEQKELAIQILRLHSDATASSIHDNLRSTNSDNQANGLKFLTLLLSDPPNTRPVRAVKNLTLSRLWRDKIYQDLAAIFRAKRDKELADSTAIIAAHNLVQARKRLTASVLAQLGDARALALLIEDDPAHPARYYWAISQLALQYPTDPALQKLVPLLASPNAEVRSEAIIALPVAWPEVYKMLTAWLDDPDSGVRYLAVSRAFKLPEDQFELIENQLKTKLADAAENVNLAAALGFAARENPSAAPVLLAWLRAHPDAPRTQDVSDALNKLIGFDAGYKAFSKPTPEAAQRNTEAFARVEAWIALHPAR